MSIFTRSLIRVNTNDKLLALTFDDGPDTIFTPLLLDLLKKFGARATFFLVGSAAKDNFSIVSRILKEGHCIGNHSWDHTPLTELSFEKRFKQITDWESELNKHEVKPLRKLFRPPYGIQNFSTSVLPKLFGYTIVGASVVAEDWKPFDLETSVNKLLLEISPGDIVLLHDRLFKATFASALDRSAMLRLVERILIELLGEYKFITVDELLARGRPQYISWTHHPIERIIQPSQADS